MPEKGQKGFQAGSDPDRPVGRRKGARNKLNPKEDIARALKKSRSLVEYVEFLEGKIFNQDPKMTEATRTTYIKIYQDLMKWMVTEDAKSIKKPQDSDSNNPANKVLTPVFKRTAG